MDAVMLREALAAFLGAERYRKFVKSICYGERMRYWQEQAWDQFVLAYPEGAISEDKLRVALRVCWVHGAELLPETINVIAEAPDRAGYYIRTGSELYPCSESTAILWTEGCPFPLCAAVVWYCPICRRAYASEHPVPRPSIDWSRLKEMAKRPS